LIFAGSGLVWLGMNGEASNAAAAAAAEPQQPPQPAERPSSTVAGGMTPPRKRFSARDRIILCEEVESVRPFDAHHGDIGEPAVSKRADAVLTAAKASAGSASR
jgi:hypothetical protein